MTWPKIDSELRSLIPALATGEAEQLEANLVKEGCRDPLVVWAGHEILLDGHHRLDICKRHEIPFQIKAIDLPDLTAARVWIILNQFGRRNLAPYTRAELALKLEPMLREQAKAKQVLGGKEKVVQNSAQAGRNPKTRDELAKIAGVSHDTIAKAKVISESADEATKDALRSNQVTINRAVKELAENKKKASRDAKRKAAQDKTVTDRRIIVGDFRNNADKVADGAVSLIFTDPPYDREASKLLPDLARFAGCKLADGGSLLCYVGNTQLPSALDALREALRYWWTISCLHAGPKNLMREYGVRTAWKPILWFVKGTRHDAHEIVADVVSGGAEKDVHEWQQAESEAAYWIEKLCPEDGLVCDPFLGGGTTAAAANALGRQWVGFEIEETTAITAQERVG